MTEVQTKSYFFIYTIKLWNAWPQDAAVAKSTWGLKSKSEEFTEEKSTDGYQIERHCCWFSEQMGCKSLGEGPERLLWGCVVIRFHCSCLLPRTFAVALCQREDAALDGPLVWLCMAVVMFLVYLQNSCAWRWEKIILSKIIYFFVWLMSSLKQMEGKKMLMEMQTGSTWQAKRHRLVPAELLLFMLHGTWKRPLLPAARAQMQKDNEMIWFGFLFFFFFPSPDYGRSDAYRLKARTHLGSSSTVRSQNPDRQ